MLVGEIGVSHDDFMHRLKYWQVVVIIRGYRRRQQPMWEALRMNAFFSMVGQADLNAMGVRNDRDLMRFPWERDVPQDLPDENQVEDIRRRLRRLNEAAQ